MLRLVTMRPPLLRWLCYSNNVNQGTPPMTTAYRFRIFTADSVGAYTVAHAASQAEALADLRRCLAPWESAAPLHGPSQSLRWFTA
jgi:hypothetical protein